ENDPETQARVAAFRQGLEKLGWTEGGNIRIDYRFAPAGPDEAQVYAKELVALRPDVLVGNSTPASAALLRETRTIPIVFAGVSDPVGSGLVASIVMPDAFTTVQRKAIIALAAQHRFPAIYPYRYEVVDGGLMSYGVDTVDLLRRAALYVDRILKGEKATDLAVQAPVKFELVINLKTAKALGLEIPPMLLARADEVIE